MQANWNDDQPIYRQLRDKVIALIIDGGFAEGAAVPSVRQVSVDYSINHLTVSKAYQQLVDEGLLFKKRGVGMFVSDGAQETLVKRERVKFLQYELPEMILRMNQLGIGKEAITDFLEKQQEDNS
mgnify:FL=1